MKKTVLMMCSLLCAALLAGCSTQEAEPYTQKRYTPDAKQISKVSIDVRDRQVDVMLSEDDQIHIDYFENNKEFYEISVSGDGVLSMTAASDKEPEDYVGENASKDVRKIQLHVPDALLETLEISTTNEDISVAALALTGDLSLTANGGSIFFENPGVGNDITLDVKNGSISGVISGSYDDYAITCDIKKGESNLPSRKESGSKKLSVTANNGDVTVDIA